MLRVACRRPVVSSLVSLPSLRRSFAAPSAASASKQKWNSDRNANANTYDPVQRQQLRSDPKERQRLLELMRSGSNHGAQFSPSYFTARPLLHDTLYQLDGLLKLHAAALERVRNDELLLSHARETQPPWVDRTLLQEAWNFRVPVEDFRKLQQRLSQLHWVSTVVTDPAVDALLHQFRKPGTGANVQKQNANLDEWGRAYAAGFRRRVKAHVWLVEVKEDAPPGRVLIDGVDMVDVLERIHDRARLTSPLEVTDCMGRYNVWCELESPLPNLEFGPTGISEAVANGIARALLLHRPELKPVLERADLLKPDLRQHERKKPGQPGARAKFQWVKR